MNKADGYDENGNLMEPASNWIGQGTRSVVAQRRRLAMSDDLTQRYINELRKLVDKFERGARMLHNNRDNGGDDWWQGVDILFASLKDYDVLFRAVDES